MTQEEIKQLVERYPYLLPRNVWTDKVPEDYDYTYCDDCWKDAARHEHIEWIKFKPYYKVIGFANGERYEKTISFEDEWNRYLKENGYDS